MRCLTAAASIETAEIPHPIRRIGDAMSLFRDPGRDMDLIDFYAFRAASVADGLKFFAGVVKKATDRRKLFAAFYGYVLGSSWHRDGLVESGHLGLPEVLRCPDVDILMSPGTYVMRGHRTGTSLRPTATRSVALAGKLWLDENDIRTHSGHQHGWGWTDNAAQTIEVQRRHLACTFASGQATWWMDQNGGWYADEPTMTEIASLASIGRRLLECDPAAAAEIAFVMDMPSMFGAEINSDLPWCVLEGMDVELSRMGAPVDKVFVDDLETAPEYRFYIVANTFFTDDRKRDLLDRCLKRDQKTVLWLYAPGYFHDNVPGEENVSALTGITIRQTQGHYTLQGRTSVDPPDGFPPDQLYGSDRRVEPTFWVTDPDAEVLAVSEDNAHAALAVKDLEGWHSAFSACVPVSSSILRYFARKAGVHMWWEGKGCFFANRSFFAVHSRTGGPQSVHLPRPCTVVDLLEDRTVCEHADTVSFDMPAGATRMFLMQEDK